MSNQPYRLSQGGRIDRSTPLRFRFNGRELQGYRGDTLASALLANGVRLLGRSFKYHRPRGVFAAGVEETSALVRVGSGGRVTPNLRATQVELSDGLLAASQHCWPSVNFDLGAVTGLFAPVLPAGFYYKTFMWPATAWMFYERFIRRAAGLGKAPSGTDPDRYSHRHAHCDVLVVGAGPAGLAAAQAAANAGARVILVDEGPEPGGSLLAGGDDVDGLPGPDWAAQTCTALAARANVRLLSRATAFGYYDDNLVGICERLTDHQDAPGGQLPRERLWLVRAGRVVLATGAIERPLVFANNDRPGVMLASAVRRYVNEYAVRPGSEAVIFCNNDSAYRTAVDLHRAGALVRAVVDSREEAVAGDHPARMRALGIQCLNGHVVTAAHGRRHLRGVEVAGVDPKGQRCIGGTRPITCDLLCVSGGWSPTVHLFSQSGGRLRFDEQLAAFVPAASRQREVSTGACRGLFGLTQCLADGARAGSQAAAALGHDAAEAQPVPACGAVDGDYNLGPLWLVPSALGRRGKRFVDLQNDVTADDLDLAVREGYSHVEHLKRYTTLGMGTDQGRTSNVTGLAILAGLRDTGIADVGTTTFRAPYGPVTLGALVGPERGRHLAPTRRSPMHRWHEEAGATFVTAGQWLRASCYPRSGENVAEATGREARAVRRNVGIVDVSTLGKIDVQGADAAEFLERIYVNRWRTLKPGRIRYGLMLREDGMVFDDGTCTRLAADRFFMTTTTANAARVLLHLERYAQTVWPDLDVHLTSTTDHWAAMAVAGPNSRAVLGPVVEGLDLSDGAFPHLASGTGRIGNAPVRLFRMTYSGELAYEVHTPADWGLHVWEGVIQAGRAMDITPYGTEAMNVLRIEKGHIVIGAEIDGRTTPDDLGMGALLKHEPWFVGQRLLERAALQAPERKKLVGLKAVDGSAEIPAGAQLVAAPHRKPPVPILGHVTSSAYGVEHERPIALGLLAGGLAAHNNDILFATSPLTGQTVGVRVTHPVFVDPEGDRPRG